jgi:hypothetical protein
MEGKEICGRRRRKVEGKKEGGGRWRVRGRGREGMIKREAGEREGRTVEW